MTPPTNVSKLLDGERILLDFSGTYINEEAQSVIGRCYLSQHYFAFFSGLFKTEVSFSFKEMESFEEQSRPGFPDTGLLFTLKNSVQIYIAGIEEMSEVKAYISSLKKHKKLSTMKSEDLIKTLAREKKKNGYSSAYSEKDKRSVKSAQSAQPTLDLKMTSFDTKSQAESVRGYNPRKEGTSDSQRQIGCPGSPLKATPSMESNQLSQNSIDPDNKEYFFLSFYFFFLLLFIFLPLNYYISFIIFPPLSFLFHSFFILFVFLVHFISLFIYLFTFTFISFYLYLTN